MSVRDQRSLWFGVGALWAVLSGIPALADDTELFVVDVTQFPEARPNVLFIMDTSGSMADKINTQPTYVPSTKYDGSCSVDRVYWRDVDSGSSPPSCSTSNWIEKSKFLCNAATVAMSTAGYYQQDRMGHYDPTEKRWERLDSNFHDRVVECEDDAGVHGDGVDTNKVYARNGDPNEMWTSNSGSKVSWGSSPLNRNYKVYDGNYLNWYYGARNEMVAKTDIVKEVATSLLDTVTGINVGLMRYNTNTSSASNGGSVIYAVEDIATAREKMKETIKSLPASGNTPLAETMYEAALYYTGRQVLYGNLKAPQASVDEARRPDNTDFYKSPIEFTCQKNFIVYLSDGEPTSDTGADGLIAAMTGKKCSGNCLDELAEYMFTKDQSPVDHPGLQNVITHTIGFAEDIQVLEDAARKGGGQYFKANDTAELSAALSNIVTSILKTQTTFTAPTVSVNSFNRTQNLNDLYITMFEPTGDVHWPGNLKKYRLRVSDSEIVDVNDRPAVDGSFFASTAQSYWSASVDGASVTTGGAASLIPDPANRNLYTCLGCTVGQVALNTSANAVKSSNSAITSAMLNLGAGDPDRALILDFARGVDVQDLFPGSPVRNQMGDPLHSQPSTVMYSQDTSIVYFATNDGYLHAIDANTGVERWAFIPEEFLGDLIALYHNESVAKKHYGIDGSIRTVIKETTNDGIVNGSDKVYLYFGMRRGGDTYYALDVTNPDNPVFLWKKKSGDMPAGLGQSWSNPTPTRINISDATYSAGNTDKLVLVFGMGYDPGHDQPALPTAPDEGNGIVIVDALNGSPLWHVTLGGGNMTSTTMPNMKYSFAADIRVIDFDGDRFADRMYAADMGGQIWRFDITNGNNRANVIRGGMIAQLGGAPAAAPAYEDTRRFYYAPDVALVSNSDQSFLHIGIGSGHRASPNSKLNHDRFYALRDYNPFVNLSQAAFNAREADPIRDADLVDIRDDLDPTINPGDPGWRMELREGNAWVGEKVLAEARTFANRVFFTTFTPGVSASANDCTPRLGTNRLYVVDLFTGKPVTNLDGSVDDEELTAEDRYTEFGGSITSEVVFLFPSPDDPDCVGEECTPPPVVCVDLNCFPPGFENNPIRTFWRQQGVD